MNNKGKGIFPLSQTECYVEGCSDLIDRTKDQYCYKEFNPQGSGWNEENPYSDLRYRHFWHGVPGITRAVGGGGGFIGYAPTLELAKQRAEYYVSNNPYAAPEVIAGEMAVLTEVNRLLEKKYGKDPYDLSKEPRRPTDCVVASDLH